MGACSALDWTVNFGMSLHFLFLAEDKLSVSVLRETYFWKHLPFQSLFSELTHLGETILWNCNSSLLES